jgi:NAD(P) transhydrogenase subunit alpha
MNWRCNLAWIFLCLALCVLLQPNTIVVAQEGAEVTTPIEDEMLVSEAVGFTKFDALMAGLSIFVLAIFVGFEVITKVPPTLHTPLMSGSNAISGITLVGALLVAGRSDYAAWFGVLAIVFATVNAIGGFWVTHRMLSMFKRK